MAPVTVNDQSQLLGLFKNVYAKKVVDAYAFMAPLASRLIQYDYQESGLGNTYNQSVDLQLEHSFTNAAAGTVPTYLAINAGKMENATAEGAQIFGRSSVSYEAISRAAASGPKAFESATKRVVKRLSKSHLKRLEMQLRVELSANQFQPVFTGRNQVNISQRFIMLLVINWIIYSNSFSNL